MTVLCRTSPRRGSAHVTGNDAAVRIAEFNAARIQAGEHEGVGRSGQVVMLALKLAVCAIEFADGVGDRVSVLERPGMKDAGIILSSVMIVLLWCE